MGPKCIKYIQTRRSNELSLLLLYASLALRLSFDFRLPREHTLPPVYHLYFTFRIHHFQGGSFRQMYGNANRKLWTITELLNTTYTFIISNIFE